MSNSKQKQNQQQQRELKQRVLNCLHKLSDRDTYTAASSELEAIAKTLTADTLSLYLSAISTTDPSDKSTLRKQCLRLITVLSENHGNALSPHLSKLLTAVTRRLRDSDSNVRSACVSAAGSIACHVTKPPFSLIAKPFLEAVFTEQEVNSQAAAALCLAAAVDAAPDPDVAALRKVMPRLEKLVKCDGFKAKAALLTLIRSVIGVGGAESQQIVRNFVPCLVEFVSCEDWAARKAAAEALGKLAVMERDALSEFKASCLKTFEAKRFDKVKAVRETMNLMLEAWKEIPDLSDDVLPPQESQYSSNEIASDGRYPPGSKISCTIRSAAPLIRTKHGLAEKPSPADGSSVTTAKKRSPLDDTAKKAAPAMFRKLDRKKSYEHKIGISVSHGPSETGVSEGHLEVGDERDLEKDKYDWDRHTKPEVKRALFHKSSDEKMKKFVSKAGSRVVPCLDEKPESTVVVSNDIGDHSINQKDTEDLSLIRNQLVQIENQQSNLLDILQRFIGRSENGMRSLESRVHGLELALDEISFDLAVSTGRMSNNDSTGAICCKLPGAEFFSSKLWKRTEGQGLTSRLSITRGTPPVATIRSVALGDGDDEEFKLGSRRYRFRGGRGIIVNPLAQIPGSSKGISEAPLSRA